MEKLVFSHMLCKQWLNETVKTLAAKPVEPFENINTVDDLQKLAKKIKMFPYIYSAGYRQITSKR